MTTPQGGQVPPNPAWRPPQAPANPAVPPYRVPPTAAPGTPATPPAYRPPAYGAPPQGAPGQPAPGQPSPGYAAPGYAAPGYGAPNRPPGQPGYRGQPAPGQPGYRGQPAPGQPGFPGQPLPPRPRRSVGAIVAIVLLSLAFVGTLAIAGVMMLLLASTSSELDDRDRTIDEQQEIIEHKETFGAAMEGLMDTVQLFDGSLYGDVVPDEDIQRVATAGWTHRYDLNLMDDDILEVQAIQAELEQLLDDAAIEAGDNTTGTVYETVTDSLGSGFVDSVVTDAVSVCKADVMACVYSSDPYTVQYGQADLSEPWMTDWIQTGVAYHEFAHVLQFTNPEPTAAAVESFDGDTETMADCFALTFLDGWALQQRIWVSSYQYWDVEIGYGYTCNEGQRQVIRDWYDQVGYTAAPVSQ